MSNILIVGFGVVGKNLHHELRNLKPYVYDKYQAGLDIQIDRKYDAAFICVDTPLKIIPGTALSEETYDLDITEVRNAIYENDAEIYVIKSTCPVGTVAELRGISGKRIIYSPEYYGNTQHCNNFEFDYTILGGDKEDCIQIQQLLQNCYDSRHIFRITDAKTAELVKFMENAWLATKVSFCNQFYNICETNKITYEELRELFILDPRVNPAV